MSLEIPTHTLQFFQDRNRQLAEETECLMCGECMDSDSHVCADDTDDALPYWMEE